MMLGILRGMKITLEHAFKKKVTHIYPYVKPQLPERSRGLIQLLVERETGVLKCEACLLCEKACPPRAITISYRHRDGFRRRPLFRPRTQSAFYRLRMSTPAPYEGRPPSSVFDVPAPASARPADDVGAAVPDRALSDGTHDVGADLRVRPSAPQSVGASRARSALRNPDSSKMQRDREDPEESGDGPVRPAKVEHILDTLPPDADLMEVIDAVQGELGYLPIEAARIISRRREVAMSDLYSMATQNPSIRLKPPSLDEGGADGG